MPHNWEKQTRHNHPQMKSTPRDARIKCLRSSNYALETLCNTDFQSYYLLMKQRVYNDTWVTASSPQSEFSLPLLHTLNVFHAHQRANWQFKILPNVVMPFSTSGTSSHNWANQSIRERTSGFIFLFIWWFVFITLLCTCIHSSLCSMFVFPVRQIRISYLQNDNQFIFNGS